MRRWKRNGTSPNSKLARPARFTAVQAQEAAVWSVPAGLIWADLDRSDRFIRAWDGDVGFARKGGMAPVSNMCLDAKKHTPASSPTSKSDEWGLVGNKRTDRLRPIGALCKMVVFIGS